MKAPNGRLSGDGSAQVCLAIRVFKAYFVAIVPQSVHHWSPKCGTLRPLSWYARPFCSSTLHKNTFCFHLPGPVNKFLHFWYTSLISFEKWPLQFFTAMLVMQHLSQVWFAQLLIQ